MFPTPTYRANLQKEGELLQQQQFFQDQIEEAKCKIHAITLDISCTTDSPIQLTEGEFTNAESMEDVKDLIQLWTTEDAAALPRQKDGTEQNPSNLMMLRRLHLGRLLFFDKSWCIRCLICWPEYRPM